MSEGLHYTVSIENWDGAAHHFNVGALSHCLEYSL